MAQLWTNPYNQYRPWSACSTCGQAWPSQKVSYNPRFGWQCPPCWDGLLQKDQFQQPIFPYEGTRKVNSPIVNTLLEGIAPGSLYQTYIYNFRDRVTGTLYLVHMVPLSISASGIITYTGSATPTLTEGFDSLQPVFDGLVWTNGYDIYVANGVLATEHYNPLSPFAMSMLQGVCDFGPSSEAQVGFFLYDRAHPENIYQVIFHADDDPVAPGQIEVVRASGPAVGGIQLADGWSYFINEDEANHDQTPFAPEIPWDNSHQFYVDPVTENLIYIP
jgi:hypothetical protein